MATSPKHPCRTEGCSALAPRGQTYCDIHRRQSEQHRGTSTERGYTERWRKARRAYLAEHPHCEGCGLPAQVVDHITAHRGDQQLFWDKGNWQALCGPCHNAKTRSGL